MGCICTDLNLVIRSNISSCLNSGYFLLSLIACMIFGYVRETVRGLEHGRRRLRELLKRVLQQLVAELS